jgi:hypothetical protein
MNAWTPEDHERVGNLNACVAGWLNRLSVQPDNNVVMMDAVLRLGMYAARLTNETRSLIPNGLSSICDNMADYRPPPPESVGEAWALLTFSRGGNELGFIRQLVVEGDPISFGSVWENAREAARCVINNELFTVTDAGWRFGYLTEDAIQNVMPALRQPDGWTGDLRYPSPTDTETEADREDAEDQLKSLGLALGLYAFSRIVQVPLPSCYAASGTLEANGSVGAISGLDAKDNALRTEYPEVTTVLTGLGSAYTGDSARLRRVSTLSAALDIVVPDWKGRVKNWLKTWHSRPAPFDHSYIGMKVIEAYDRDGNPWKVIECYLKATRENPLDERVLQSVHHAESALETIANGKNVLVYNATFSVLPWFLGRLFRLSARVGVWIVRNRGNGFFIVKGTSSLELGTSVTLKDWSEPTTRNSEL